MYLSAVDRLDRVLNGILPGLLAQAWDEGADFVARHPDMSAEYVRAANPYRQEAVLPDLLAQAWGEGRQLGLKQADFEFGAALSMPDLTNPYRQESDR